MNMPLAILCYILQWFWDLLSKDVFHARTAAVVVFAAQCYTGHLEITQSYGWVFLLLCNTVGVFTTEYCWKQRKWAVWIHGCLLKLISLNDKIITRVLSNKNIYNSLWSIFSRQDSIQEVHDLHIQYLVARKKNVLNLKGNRHVLLWKTSHRNSNKGKIPVKCYGLDVAKLDFFKQWTNIQVFFRCNLMLGYQNVMYCINA